MGAEINIYSQINGHNFVARVDAQTEVEVNHKFPLYVDMDKVHFFDKETEMRIILSNSSIDTKSEQVLNV